MIKALPPSDAYRQLQHALLESIERRVLSSSACRKKLESERSMKDRLEKMMMKRFALRTMPWQSHHLAIDVEKKLYKLFQKSHCHFLDHQTIYKATVMMGTATVFVTQPYLGRENKVPEEIELLLKQCLVELVDMNEWAFHYPGRASCYGLVISRDSAAALLTREDDHLVKQAFLAQNIFSGLFTRNRALAC